MVLDGQGDGVRLAPTGSGAAFDLNGDGTPEALAWPGPTDALLVWDRNGDGRIDNGSELLALVEAGIQSINLTPGIGNVAGQTNVKGGSDRYGGITRTLWDLKFNTAASAPVTTSRYAAGIEKISSASGTALLAVNTVWCNPCLTNSDAHRAVGARITTSSMVC